MNKIFESLLNWANCSTRFALTFYFVWGISKGSRARCIFYLKNIKFLFVFSTNVEIKTRWLHQPIVRINTNHIFSNWTYNNASDFHKCRDFFESLIKLELSRKKRIFTCKNIFYLNLYRKVENFSLK